MHLSSLPISCWLVKDKNYLAVTMALSKYNLGQNAYYGALLKFWVSAETHVTAKKDNLPNIQEERRAGRAFPKFYPLLKLVS